MKTIIVTGGTGYLGSHIVTALLALNHKVIIFKLSSSALDRIHAIKDKVICYDTDLVNPETSFIENGKIDAIIHCATLYGRNQETFYELYNANTLLPLGLLENAVNYKTPVFLNTDTVSNKYLNPYSLSKKHFSEIGKYYAEKRLIKFINIKLEHMYGPGDDISKFPSYILKSCLNNIKEIKLTAGDQKRDFIYIDDIVSAYITLIDKYKELPDDFCDIDLGSGKPVRIKDFVTMVHRKTSSTTDLLFGALPYRENEILESTSDISVLTDLGWHPETSLEDGIEKMLKEERR